MNYLNNIPEFAVSELNKAVKEVIEKNFNYIRIRGEISEVKNAAKGQIYITLKDNDSILSGVIWDQRKKFLPIFPEIGMEVLVTGKITTWSRFKTTYQIDIDKLELAGEGALLRLIEERKKRLKAKGIFDQDKKKPLPFLPNKIGVITSAAGSVIHDIINRINDRFPISVDVWPTAVQGSEAVSSIIEAIKGFNDIAKDDQPEVIIIARGGGSTEDLMAFNDENLALEVFKSSIPIISAIGHETDTAIIDFVSDERASTPTAAAERVTPDRLELINSISTLNQRLNYFIKNSINTYYYNIKIFEKLLKAPNLLINIFKEKIEKIFINLENYLDYSLEKNNLKVKNYIKDIKPPFSKIDLNKSYLKNYSNTLEKKINEKKSFKKESLSKLSRLLNSNSINLNLKKGYSILSVKNKIIKNKKLIKSDENIKARFYKDSIEFTIKKIN